jgi:hypothetical protein
MTAPYGQYLLVELEPELHRSRIVGMFHNIKALPGVVSVTDMSVISQATLDVILRQPTETLKRQDPAAYSAIRAYARRKQQPKLDLEQGA